MKEIFEILEQNARATPAQIATLVGKPVREVEKIIKQAEKDGTILKYKAIVNWPKLEKEDIWALIEVRVTPQRGVGFECHCRAHLSIPRSVFCLSSLRHL